jgi:5-methylcytosine-specific restriction endonuclease McrA
MEELFHGGIMFLFLKRVVQATKDAAAGKGLHLRSKQWPRVEHRHLKKEPTCQWCGSLEKPQVHHILPFHLFPDKELDDSNLITLCEVESISDHLEKGHLGNFKTGFNPQIREQCNERNRRWFFKCLISLWTQTSEA